MRAVLRRLARGPVDVGTLDPRVLAALLAGGIVDLRIVAALSSAGRAKMTTNKAEEHSDGEE